MAYQLSSLVLYPPQTLKVRITVFYSREDQETVDLLNTFNRRQPPNVVWNWAPLETPRLLRRAIGRNAAALSTKADWIWFTDCDQVFYKGCLDCLHDQLQGRNDLLLYPKVVACGALANKKDNTNRIAKSNLKIVEIHPDQFAKVVYSRAIGPLQITHGDVARKLGYCNAIGFYQKPVDSWRKAYEDRVFRWLLGTQGQPIEVPGLYRIEHLTKGRDADRSTNRLSREIKEWMRRRRRNRRRKPERR